MRNNLIKQLKKYGLNSVVIMRTLKVFTILFVIVILVITIAYNCIGAFSRKMFLSESRVELKKSAVIFENIFREAEYLAANLFLNFDAKLFFSLNDKKTLNAEQENQLLNFFNSYYNKAINNIYLCNLKNNVIFTSEGIVAREDLENSYWLDNLEEGFVNDYKIVFRKSKQNYLQSVFFIKKQPGSKSYVAIELNIRNIKNQFEEFISKEATVYILMNDEIMFSNGYYEKPDWFAQISSDEGYNKKQNCVYVCQNSQYYNFRYIICSSGLTYITDLQNMHFIFILIFIACFALIVAAAYFTSSDSLSFISVLINALDMKRLPKNLKNNEIKYISEKIIYLINYNEKLKQDIAGRIVDYNDMQQKALQKQITPHFINNSLTVLGTEMLKEYGYGSNCVAMLTKLTRIIRYSYISENVFVTVREELDFLKDYMTFLQYRYASFDYKIECSAETENLQIIKMILQPLVENAVFYGIKDRGGEVLVRVYKEDQNLQITVFDNGVGMDEDKITQIYQSTNDDGHLDREKIGIKNVFARLRLIYGNDVQITIRSEVGRFTEFKIIIPIRNL